MPLRTMEPDVVSLLVDEMTAMGVNFVTGNEITSLASAADGTKTVQTKDGTDHPGYDEVLFAIGRKPVTDTLNLGAAGVEVTERGEVVVDKTSKTTADGVYAVGDIITGACRRHASRKKNQLRPPAAAASPRSDGPPRLWSPAGAVQLTPVAIAAGRLLSDRLFNNVPVEETCMDYEQVPTVVFSHPPLAVMGLTEAQVTPRWHPTPLGDTPPGPHPDWSSDALCRPSSATARRR